MQTRNTETSWGAVQQAIHWTVALLVVAQLAVGLIMAGGERGATPGWVFPTHVTLGVSILLLMLARLVWRTRNPVPASPATLKPSDQKLALGTHYAWYVLLILQPIGGILLALTGLGVFFYLHLTGVAAIVLLISLHVAGALRHEFLLKDNTLRRMTPLPYRPEPAGVPEDRLPREFNDDNDKGGSAGDKGGSAGSQPRI